MGMTLHICMDNAPHMHPNPRSDRGVGMGHVGVWGIRAWKSTQMGKIKC